MRWIIIITIPCSCKLMFRDANLEQPDPFHHEEYEIRSMQEEVRARGGKCREQAEWCFCSGGREGVNCFPFRSMQETTCPFKHWFDSLHLLSVLRRPEHS